MRSMFPRFKSFVHAFHGLRYGLATQRNLRFHFLAACLVLVLARAFRITESEFWMLSLAVILVIAAELFNTAVELAVDLAMPNQHPKAKAAKDVAATAVLLTAVFAVVTGWIVFDGYILEWWESVRAH